MPEKLAVLVQNELNLNLNEIFSDAVERGIQIRHLPLYHTQDEKEVIRAARDCNYVIAGREPWNLKTLAACSKDLKLIVRFGAGYDTVDLMSATEFGIAVANAPGANARAVAEHTLALMMSVLRNVTRYDRELRAGGVVSKMSQTLEGTVALVGFGNIGQEVARLLQVFPVRVIAYNPYPNYEKAAELGVEIVSMNQAIEQADIISLHLPGTEEMRDFIDSKTISQMKDGVYIINTSRGSVLDEQALAKALKNGKVAGAGLDAFKIEPFDQNSILKRLPNVVLTPHAAAVSTQGVRGVFESCANTLSCFLRGQPIASILNPQYRFYSREYKGA